MMPRWKMLWRFSCAIEAKNLPAQVVTVPSTALADVIISGLTQDLCTFQCL